MTFALADCDGSLALAALIVVFTVHLKASAARWSEPAGRRDVMGFRYIPRLFTSPSVMVPVTARPLSR